MAEYNENSERHVIPIWMESRQAASSPEMRRLTEPKQAAAMEPETPAKLVEFQQSPSPETALDVLNAARKEEVSGLDVTEAARLIRDDLKMPGPARLLARELLGEIEEVVEVPENPIRTLRQRLIAAPGNPLAWTDLARHYASEGLVDKARRAMLSAVQLGGGNRWITRVASRLFIHLDEVDYSLAVIRRNPMVKKDPWLMAAEVATSQYAGRSPAFWKEARHLLSADVRPVHLGELSCAVGTMEVMSGQVKRGRHLFQQSLLEPTGNVLAQVQWAERTRRVTNLELPAIEGLADASEAKFWKAYNDQDMRAAVNFAMDWMDEEPYSGRASIMASYVASLLDDYPLLGRILKTGLKANPENFCLRINRAFCVLVSGGKVSAKDIGSSMETLVKDLVTASRADDRDTAAHAYATIGLFHYRSGNSDRGREWYDAASRIFERINSASAILCKLNHLREALLANAEWTATLVADIKNNMKEKQGRNDVVTPGARFYAGRVLHVLDNSDRAKVVFGQPDAVSFERVKQIEGLVTSSSDLFSNPDVFEVKL